jgi:putative ABC transport system permease protein
MSGFEADTSLVAAALWMLKALLVIALASFVAGLATLPLFYFVLLALNGWFWGLDESRNTDAERPPLTRVAAPALAWLVPILSVAATLFLASYFFGEGQAKKASWGKLRFDEFTRAVAKSMHAPPPETGPGSNARADDGADPNEAALRRSVQGVRAFSMISLLLMGPFPLLVVVLNFALGRMGLVLIIRSLSRNLLRTSLTYLAIFVLVCVITFIWSILDFLALVTTEKEGNLKAIITERKQIPSQMKPSHEAELKAMIQELPEENRPKGGDDDMMTWAFVGGSLDPQNRTPQNSLFLFCMEPKKLLTMMDGLDDLTGEQRAQLQRAIDRMEEDRTCAVLGKDRLAQLGKRVGDEITLSSFNYADMTFKLKIIAVFPEGRYDQSAIMHRDYLKRSLEAYEGEHGGKAHPLADKSLNLIWLRMPDKHSFELLAEKVNSSGKFNPAIKMETASSAIGSFLEPMKDVLWAMRYLLVPALVATMTLVISNAISISVRERRTEMAVLKVLGFRPWMVMALVLGEAVFIGALSGFMATATAFAAINAVGGVPFPIAFFPAFFIPAQALVWGPAMGAFVAILGSFLPAWSARSVKVSEVFAKVA